ncbi:putative nLP/P60 protein [Mycobacterium xenopi 3993]|nr:putative nLP/P60 protein [Mycobacterium xenopi 3993]
MARRAAALRDVEHRLGEVLGLSSAKTDADRAKMQAIIDDVETALMSAAVQGDTPKPKPRSWPPCATPLTRPATSSAPPPATNSPTPSSCATSSPNTSPPAATSTSPASPDPAPAPTPSPRPAPRSACPTSGRRRSTRPHQRRVRLQRPHPIRHRPRHRRTSHVAPHHLRPNPLRHRRPTRRPATRRPGLLQLLRTRRARTCPALHRRRPSHRGAPAGPTRADQPLPSGAQARRVL